MKGFAALALAVAVAATPLCAQRGAGVRGGLSGSRSLPAFHGGRGFAPAAHSAYPGSTSRGSIPPGRGVAIQRPAFYGRRPGYPSGYPGQGRYRRPYSPNFYSAGIPYSGVGYMGDPGNSDNPGWIDSSYQADPNFINDQAQQPDGPSSPPSYPPGQNPGENSPPASPANEDAVTLIFKDGRPPEQIHNYALTRTTLYVRDQHRRDIPVNQLDLAATTRINHDAGTDFRVPGIAQ